MDSYHRHSPPLPWIGLTGYPGSGKNALAEVLVAAILSTGEVADRKKKKANGGDQ